VGAIFSIDHLGMEVLWVSPLQVVFSLQKNSEMTNNLLTSTP